jgi:hypothetical protein
MYSKHIQLPYYLTITFSLTLLTLCPVKFLLASYGRKACMRLLSIFSWLAFVL